MFPCCPLWGVISWSSWFGEEQKVTVGPGTFPNVFANWAWKLCPPADCDGLVQLPYRRWQFPSPRVTQSTAADADPLSQSSLDRENQRGVNSTLRTEFTCELPQILWTTAILAPSAVAPSRHKIRSRLLFTPFQPNTNSPPDGSQIPSLPLRHNCGWFRPISAWISAVVQLPCGLNWTVVVRH